MLKQSHLAPQDHENFLQDIEMHVREIRTFLKCRSHELEYIKKLLSEIENYATSSRLLYTSYFIEKAIESLSEEQIKYMAR